MTAGQHFATAINARQAGLCPIPVATNGTKMPGLTTWRRYVQTSPDFTGEQPSPGELAEWFTRADPPGLGLVCGAISGQLEMLEVEGRYVNRWPDVETALTRAGLDELWHRIDSGYRETTPSGGIHWLYRCPTVEHNRRLAQRPAPDKPNGRDVLIETRGEGGFVVVAPTAGIFDDYPDGAEWHLQSGGFNTIATITPDERTELLRILATFDEMPEPEPIPTTLSRPGQHDGDRPGDEYNRATTWGELLAGWTPVFARGDVTYWRRPGKAHGISATTNHGGTDRLKVFTTSTGFQTAPEHTYDKLGAYALLHHHGDITAAARALRPAQEAAKPRTVLGAPVTPPQPGEGSTSIVDVPERLLDDFLAEGEEEYDWLIPNLLEKGDRLILTAPEGLGKSTLLRQIAAAAAAGVHPFDGTELPRRLRSLVVDFENGRRFVRRQLVPLRDAAGRRIELFVVVQPQGMDVLAEIDCAWLEGIISRTRPEIVTLGPVYKMAHGDPNDELATKPVAMELDRLRETYGFALLLEHHQPYGEGAKRPLRPVGWSGWSRWPEFGLALVGKPEDDTVEVKRWRGDRDSRQWPAKLRKYGQPWPFEVEGRRDVSYAAMKAVCVDEGRMLSFADLASRLACPLVQVERAVGQNAADWRALQDVIAPY